MSDLINREQAIGAVDVYLKRLCNYIGTPKDTELYALERGLLTSVKIDIGELPSAELGTDLAEVGTDCISRQAALDAIRTLQTYKLFEGDDMILVDKAEVQTELMMLPPAQPEKRTETHGVCLDAISRQAVIDALNSKRVSEDNGHMWREYRNDNVDMAIEIMQSLPSTQLEPKRGKWIKVEHTWSGYACSVCGDVPYMQTCMGKPMYDFCPYCGADMREVTK